MPKLNARLLKEVMGTSPNKAESSARLVQFFREGFAEKKFKPEDVSLRDVALVTGVADPYDMEGSIGRAMSRAVDGSQYSEAELFVESNPNVTTTAFQVISAELVALPLIEGYENNEGLIADRLVTTMQLNGRRNVKISGLTSLAGPLEVKEGHPYSESGFEDKYCTSAEIKKGRIISITEEVIIFDQTAEIVDKARNLGWYIRQDREKTIVHGVCDAGALTGHYVYRPKGVGVPLYDATGKHYNYVGVGNTTSTAFNAAVDLTDWEDVDKILQYRAKEIKDDRVDGKPEPIAGLNNGRNILLVPFAKQGVAKYIAGATQSVRNTQGTEFPVNQGFMNQNPVSSFIGDVLSSELMPSEDFWYYGDPKKQFKWTEVYGLQTFFQGRESEAMFERDVAFRVKCRYFGGLTATDTIFFTRVDRA